MKLPLGSASTGASALANGGWIVSRTRRSESRRSRLSRRSSESSRGGIGTRTTFVVSRLSVSRRAEIVSVRARAVSRLVRAVSRTWAKAFE